MSEHERDDWNRISAISIIWIIMLSLGFWAVIWLFVRSVL
jgi:hypothetical protein